MHTVRPSVLYVSHVICTGLTRIYYLNNISFFHIILKSLSMANLEKSYCNSFTQNV